MKRRGLAGLATALGMTSCSSTDREFDEWCKEKEANGWHEARADEKACSFKEYLTDEEKVQVMQTPTDQQNQGVHVRAVGQERRRKDH